MPGWYSDRWRLWRRSCSISWPFLFISRWAEGLKQGDVAVDGHAMKHGAVLFEGCRVACFGAQPYFFPQLLCETVHIWWFGTTLTYNRIAACDSFATAALWLWQINELWVGSGEGEVPTLPHITGTSSIAEREADFDVSGGSSNTLWIKSEQSPKFYHVQTLNTGLLALSSFSQWLLLLEKQTAEEQDKESILVCTKHHFCTLMPSLCTTA